MTETTQLQVTSWNQLAEQFPGLETLGALEDSGLIQFRNYQALAVLAVVFSGFRGVVRAATGSGKTLIASAVCGAMLPKKTVVMIHGRELVAQTYKEFCKFLGKENVGVISADTYEPKAVTIASIDTFGFYLGEVPLNAKTKVPIMDPNKFKDLQKRFSTFLNQEVDMLVFDEVHHGSADLWQDIGKHTEAFYRVGLSGTPLKHDELSDMLMLSLVGPVVYDLGAPWLQEQGYLAQANLLVKTLDCTSASTRKLNWQEARKQLLVQNHERTVNIASDIAVAIQQDSTRLLVLTGNSVELAENIAKEVQALTVPLTRKLGRSPYTLITGKMSAKKVSRAFNDLRKGNVRCVITTKLADEGIDVPDINLLYLVGGGKAYVSSVQRVGRGLRVKGDRSELLVVDYFTKGNKYVERHDRQRLHTYEQEDFFSEIDFIDAT